MTSPPRRSDAAGRAYLRLRAAARAKGRPTDELLVLYTLEAFLRRLAATEHAARFVLKGGVLLAGFGERRPTRDVDFQVRQMDADAGVIARTVCDVAMVRAADAVEFDVTAVTTEVIREDGAYQGVRVRMPARLATARTVFSVDVSVGDPVVPAPQRVELPSLLDGDPPVTLLGYPLEMVLAEKLVTVLQRGTVNTRWRDFADIWTISRHRRCDGTSLQAALGAVARYRTVELRPLLPALDAYPAIAQGRWSSWIRQHRPPMLPPADFADVLADLSQFADPALCGAVDEHTWVPTPGEWVADRSTVGEVNPSMIPTATVTRRRDGRGDG